MDNKIGKIKYFISLAILFVVFIGNCNFAGKAFSADNQINGKLIHNSYISTADIENKFKNKLNLNGNVLYSKVPRGLVVSINSNLFFNQNDDELLNSAEPLLHDIAEILISLNKICTIESSSDFDLPQNSKYNYNWELSTVRANKIVDYLIKNEKINPNNISAIGYGEISPLKTNYNFSSRIDFVIMNYEKLYR